MKCFDTQTLAAHLDGELTRNESQAIAAHLKDCPSCRTQLERLRRTVAALPSAVNVSEDAAFTREVVTQLGARAPAPKRWAWASGLAAATVLVITVVMPPLGDASSNAGTFTARGGNENSKQVGFTAFVHPASTPSIRHAVSAGQTLQLNDGFSFEVWNHTAKPLFAALFAVDSKGETHWFYPAVIENGADPSAVPIASQPAVLALPDGITPEAAATGKLTLVGVFLDHPFRVSDIERQLRHGGIDKLSPQFPVATVQSVVMNVVQENQQ